MVNNLATGECLCGTVQFHISGTFESFFLCHCSRCRKGSGSAHSASLFSPTASLTWVSGEEKIKIFRLSGTRHTKSFCSECGSALPVSQPEVGLLMVPAGSLDSRIDIRPRAHICYSSRANWENDLASVEKLDRFPS